MLEADVPFFKKVLYTRLATIGANAIRRRSSRSRFNSGMQQKQSDCLVDWWIVKRRSSLGTRTCVCNFWQSSRLRIPSHCSAAVANGGIDRRPVRITERIVRRRPSKKMQID
ncbi:uncharacterized protein LOC118647559 [Monomorium pharaonis]|uniref:uncharacterized protein LOC118647559 n=1 Tax=Monomorium pharaonis TaxID=307658 RepID=UPI001747712E|nr:uncharacterized protein LOC118647559 [Monomorium pharaonis]